MKKIILSIFLIIFTTKFSVADSNIDSHCLATMMYHEARGEPHAGQIAVANVVLNRTTHKSFPSSVCDVVYQHGQFGWARNPKPIKHKNIYDNLLGLANNLLYNDEEIVDHSNGALYFNTTTGKKPKKNARVTTRIGSHTFYR